MLLHLRYCCLAWMELEFSTTFDNFAIQNKLWEFNIMAMEKSDIGLNLF